MSERTARVAEGFREVLAEEIPRLKDPRIGFITVTRVDVTPDLRKAHVWYTVYGDDSAKAGSRAGLRSSRSRLRQVIGQQVRLKFTPELEFHEDLGIENLGRVDELLKQDEEGATDGV